MKPLSLHSTEFSELFKLPTMSVVASNQVFLHFLGNFYSRRLLLGTPFHQSPTTVTPPGPGNSHDPSQVYRGNNGFDLNVVMVVSVFLCALLCSLGLNCIIRCALRCSSTVASRSGSGNSSDRVANKGIQQKVLKVFPVINYSSELKLPGLDTECIICLSEFTAGERLRLLPKCNHGFHVRCIDKWLSSHSSCPKCRHCLIETCQKIVGCSRPAASTSQNPEPAQETIVTITPLEPEGLIRNYRVIN